MIDAVASFAETRRPGKFMYIFCYHFGNLRLKTSLKYRCLQNKHPIRMLLTYRAFILQTPVSVVSQLHGFCSSDILRCRLSKWLLDHPMTRRGSSKLLGQPPGEEETWKANYAAAELGRSENPMAVDSRLPSRKPQHSKPPILR